MSQWGSAKSRKVLKALLKIGWEVKRESSGSHKILSRHGFEDYTFAFHEGEEIGPRMLGCVFKPTQVVSLLVFWLKSHVLASTRSTAKMDKCEAFGAKPRAMGESNLELSWLEA